MQPVNTPNQQFTGKYNNVIFGWTDKVGLSVVHQIIGYLLHKDEKPKAVNE